MLLEANRELTVSRGALGQDGDSDEGCGELHADSVVWIVEYCDDERSLYTVQVG